MWNKRKLPEGLRDAMVFNSGSLVAGSTFFKFLFADVWKVLGAGALDLQTRIVGEAAISASFFSLSL